jgi:CheY-like chemotaxis protein
VNAASVTRLRRSQPLNLLVVEDDVITRCVICDELRALNFRVLEASSGEDALAVLKTLPVHLLFVDLHMPGSVDGVGVARYAHGLRPSPRIILTSGKIGPGEIAGLDAFGPFLRKPYPVSQAVDLIRRSLDPTGDLQL